MFGVNHDHLQLELFVQAAYLSSKSGSSDASGLQFLSNVGVFVAMIFSILSTVSASMEQITSICSAMRNEIAKFTHVIDLTATLVIESSNFRKQHAFSHKAIESSIQGVLNNCENDIIWSRREGVFTTLEVYHVANYIISSKTIKAEFMIQMFTMGQRSDLRDIIDITVTQMGQSGTQLNKKLIEVNFLMMIRCHV